MAAYGPKRHQSTWCNKANLIQVNITINININIKIKININVIAATTQCNDVEQGSSFCPQALSTMQLQDTCHKTVYRPKLPQSLLDPLLLKGSKADLRGLKEKTASSRNGSTQKWY